jgi:hypothetical protein
MSSPRASRHVENVRRLSRPMRIFAGSPWVARTPPMAALWAPWPRLAPSSSTSVFTPASERASAVGTPMLPAPTMIASNTPPLTGVPPARHARHPRRPDRDTAAASTTSWLLDAGEGAQRHLDEERPPHARRHLAGRHALLSWKRRASSGAQVFAPQAPMPARVSALMALRSRSPARIQERSSPAATRSQRHTTSSSAMRAW